MTISIDKSIEQEQKNTATTTIRRAKYKINPLILHRWSPRSMTGEELDDDTIMSFLKQQDGLLLHTIINHGDSYMLRKTHHIGTSFLIY